MNPLSKIVIFDGNSLNNGLIVGVVKEPDQSVTYSIEPLRNDFGRFKSKRRYYKLNSKEIKEKNYLIIEKYENNAH